MGEVVGRWEVGIQQENHYTPLEPTELAQKMYTFLIRVGKLALAPTRVGKSGLSQLGQLPGWVSYLIMVGKYQGG